MPEGGRVEAVSGEYRAHQIEPLKSIMLTANAARFASSASASRRAGWSSAPFSVREKLDTDFVVAIEFPQLKRLVPFREDEAERQHVRIGCDPRVLGRVRGLPTIRSTNFSQQPA